MLGEAARCLPHLTNEDTSQIEVVLPESKEQLKIPRFWVVRNKESRQSGSLCLEGKLCRDRHGATSVQVPLVVWLLPTEGCQGQRAHCPGLQWLQGHSGERPVSHPSLCRKRPCTHKA
jgi:hypothetical protein